MWAKNNPNDKTINTIMQITLEILVYLLAQLNKNSIPISEITKKKSLSAINQKGTSYKKKYNLKN